MMKLYIMQEKSDTKIIICDVSAYNTHPDFRPDFRRKKCVLYAENYGKINPHLKHIFPTIMNYLYFLSNRKGELKFELILSISLKNNLRR